MAQLAAACAHINTVTLSTSLRSSNYGTRSSCRSITIAAGVQAQQAAAATHGGNSNATIELHPHPATAGHDTAPPLVLKHVPGQAIPCSLPLKCHPAYGSLRDGTEEWTLSLMSGHPLLSCEAGRRFVRAALYPLFFCTMYPQALDEQRMRLISEFSMWFFILDDTVEEGRDDAEHVRLEQALQVVDAASSLLQLRDNPSCASMARLLREHPAASIGPHVRSFLQAFADTWAGIWALAPGSHMRERLRLSTLQSLQLGYKSELLRRRHELGKTAAPAQLQSDEAVRHQAAFEMPGMWLLEFARAAEFDSQNLQSRLMKDVIRAVCKHGVMVNDLISAEKELAMGTENNFYAGRSSDGEVTNLSRDEMKAGLKKMIQDVERRYLELVEDVKAAGASSFGGEAAKQDMVHFALDMGLTISANLYWSLITARYHGVPMDDLPEGLLMHHPNRVVVLPNGNSLFHLDILACQDHSPGQ